MHFPQRQLVREAKGVASALSTLALAACSTISVESQARQPKSAPAFERTLVVVLPVLSGDTRTFINTLPSSGEMGRRACEDTLVGQLGSLHAFSSHALLSSSQIQQRPTLDALVQWASGQSADGLVVMSLAGVSEEAASFAPQTIILNPDNENPQFAIMPSIDHGPVATIRARVILVSVADSQVRWTAAVRGLQHYPPSDMATEVAAAIARKLKSDLFHK